MNKIKEFFKNYKENKITKKQFAVVMTILSVVIVIGLAVIINNVLEQKRLRDIESQYSIVDQDGNNVGDDREYKLEGEIKINDDGSVLITTQKNEKYLLDKTGLYRFDSVKENEKTLMTSNLKKVTVKDLANNKSYNYVQGKLVEVKTDEEVKQAKEEETTLPADPSEGQEVNYGYTYDEPAPAPAPEPVATGPSQEEINAWIAAHPSGIYEEPSWYVRTRTEYTGPMTLEQRAQAYEIVGRYKDPNDPNVQNVLRDIEALGANPSYTCPMTYTPAPITNVAAKILSGQPLAEVGNPSPNKSGERIWIVYDQATDTAQVWSCTF